MTPHVDAALERELLRQATLALAADLAAIDPDYAGDTGALADQLEAQAHTFLADRGIDIRTSLELPDA